MRTSQLKKQINETAAEIVLSQDKILLYKNRIKTHLSSLNTLSLLLMLPAIFVGYKIVKKAGLLSLIKNFVRIYSFRFLKNFLIKQSFLFSHLFLK